MTGNTGGGVATGAATPWNSTESIPESGRDVTTLVEGHTFCLSEPNGDIVSGRPQGLFVLDTRILSRWVLLIDGAPIDGLAVDLPAPFDATFAGRTRPGAGQADSTIVAFRHRSVGNGMREVVVVRNVGMHAAPVTVELRCGADFANLFDVKQRRDHAPDAPTVEHTPTTLRFAHHDERRTTQTAVRCSRPAATAAGRAVWQLQLDPGGEQRLCLEVEAQVDGACLPLRFTCAQPDRRPLPIERLTRWRQAAPLVASDAPGFDTAVRRGIEDLGALRLFDPAHTERPVVAAGAPWFMALFGRDSLLAGWMSLPVDPDLALGVVETLAALQGVDVNPATEEQPGRILHEARLGGASNLALHGGAPYYGSADATPLFVMLVGELLQWGADPATIAALMPHVDAALEWITAFGDGDGDGYVEYRRATPDGLANQGWKDSWDGIRCADGRMPDAPIALCEVQGYVYAAYRARADLARAGHDPATATRWSRRADELRAAFNRDFWLADRGWYALGLDADKRPIDALASNMGHCLWTGIVDPEHAAAVGGHLAAGGLFSGWGVRTLAAGMAAYNPVSYHNGSVWPHDTAICAAGLMRYGLVEHAHRVVGALLDAATHHAGRLPELFAGFDRSELGVPAPYPTSCSPQAWAAAAPLLALRTLLRLDPAAPDGRLWVSPTLPPWMRRLHVDGIAVSGQRLAVHVDADRVEIGGSAHLEVVPTPRPLP